MFGWLPDEYDSRDFDAEDAPGLMGSPIELPAYVDLSTHAPQVRDQGITSTCVLQAATDAMFMRAAIAGKPIARPSVLHAYYVARAIEGDVLVQDRGCYPRLAMQALVKHGVCSEETWPFVPNEVNSVPPWDAMQHATDARGMAYYRITGYDDERLTMIHRALSAGMPVVFGTEVDDALFDGSVDVIGRVKGKVRGKHAMLIVGRSAGGWLVRNSWGSGWSLGGYCRISDDRMASTDVDDVWVISDAPKVVS